MSTSSETIYDLMLAKIHAVLERGLDHEGCVEILRIIGAPAVALPLLRHFRLYSETLPKGMDPPFTVEQRLLHFLWDYFDKLPVCLMLPFSTLFRRALGERLFKACGGGLICEENVRFNFGQFLELGDFVFCNRNVFLDTKGGIRLGSHVALAEDVRIFTHGHSEASHIERSYEPVVVEDYAKVYAGAVLMPGVTVGAQAIVAAHAVVTKDVPPNMVVAGVPAKVIRERQTEGRSGEDLDHLWLF